MLTVLAFLVDPRRADRRPRVRPLPGGGGLRRQGAALLGRLRPRRCGAASPRPDGTEFVVGALPLGGYVQMLDEREGAGRARTSCSAPSTASRLRSARRSSPPGRSPTCCWRSLLYAARQLDRRRGAEGGARPARWRPAWPSAPACAPATGCARWSRDGDELAATCARSNDLRWQVTQAALRWRGPDARWSATRDGRGQRAVALDARAAVGARDVDAKLMPQDRPRQRR